MLTFVCCPKPFITEFELIQKNAILSWNNIGLDCKIVVCCDDYGVEGFCKKYNFIHEPNVERNEYGTPLVYSIFEKGYKHTDKNGFVCYINSDIILTSSFTKTYNEFKSNSMLKNFLIIGQRWDMKNTYPINFNDPNWENDLEQIVYKENRLHSECGIDYFLHSPTTFNDIPKTFAIGRYHWDRWLVYNAVTSGIHTIDVSKTVLCVHQDGHYYASHNIIPVNLLSETDEVKRNCALFAKCGKNIDSSKYKTIYDNDKNILFIER
jgi:hypothetical protein